MRQSAVNLVKLTNPDKFIKILLSDFSGFQHFSNSNNSKSHFPVYIFPCTLKCRWYTLMQNYIDGNVYNSYKHSYVYNMVSMYKHKLYK